LILDLVIEAGNPADSERFLPMLKRHIAFYGEAPRQGSVALMSDRREAWRDAKLEEEESERRERDREARSDNRRADSGRQRIELLRGG
jgi:IS5 family transposase